MTTKEEENSLGWFSLLSRNALRIGDRGEMKRYLSYLTYIFRYFSRFTFCDFRTERVTYGAKHNLDRESMRNETKIKQLNHAATSRFTDYTKSCDAT